MIVLGGIPKHYATMLQKRLHDCESVVTKNGWLYDKVPSSLVGELLDFLEHIERCGYKGRDINLEADQ